MVPSGSRLPQHSEWRAPPSPPPPPTPPPIRTSARVSAATVGLGCGCCATLTTDHRCSQRRRWISRWRLTRRMRRTIGRCRGAAMLHSQSSRYRDSPPQITPDTWKICSVLHSDMPCPPPIPAPRKFKNKFCRLWLTRLGGAGDPGAKSRGGAERSGADPALRSISPHASLRLPDNRMFRCR